MPENKTYIFKSERLGFRNWLDGDLPEMSAINADPEVMKFFPSIQSPEQTAEFIQRMQKQFAEKGYCYFAVDKLGSFEFMGFIGLSDQTYQADFTPCVDVGWRLKKNEWNKGYATEGAKACLEFGFRTIQLEKIYATAPTANLPSIEVMRKAGMTKVMSFKHPLLANNEDLEECVLYEIITTFRKSSC